MSCKPFTGRNGQGTQALPCAKLPYPRIPHLEPFKCRVCVGKRLLYGKPCSRCKGTGKETILTY